MTSGPLHLHSLSVCPDSPPLTACLGPGLGNTVFDFKCHFVRPGASFEYTYPFDCPEISRCTLVPLRVQECAQQLELLDCPCCQRHSGVRRKLLLLITRGHLPQLLFEPEQPLRVCAFLFGAPFLAFSTRPSFSRLLLSPSLCRLATQYKPSRYCLTSNVPLRTATNIVGETGPAPWARPRDEVGDGCPRQVTPPRESLSRTSTRRTTLPGLPA